MADSAQGIIRTALTRYGLGSLADWAWALYLAGNSIEEIMLELRTRPEYKTRFPWMEALAKAGRAISEEESIQFEQGLRNIVAQFGLPQDIYGSRDYVKELLLSDTSLAEFQSRAQLAQASSLTAPLEYRMALNRLYGITPGQLTSYWLETDRTLGLLEKQFAAASIAGEATIAGLGDISTGTAQRLVEAGVSREQARQGLSRTSAQLAQRLPGEVESGLGANRLVTGALGVGPDTQALERLIRQRVASFASGGGAVATQQGAIGLGTTRR